MFLMLESPIYGGFLLLAWLHTENPENYVWKVYWSLVVVGKNDIFPKDVRFFDGGHEPFVASSSCQE